MRFCRPVARHKRESDGNAYASKEVTKVSVMFCKCADFVVGVITFKEFRRTSKHAFILPRYIIIFIYSKTCLKRNAIPPVFFFSVFTGFRFTKGCVLIKQSTKNMIA